MIKGKPSYPFETIALAVAFSPRLEALIAETKRFASLFNARVVFIHVGKRTAEKERHLHNILSHYEFTASNSTTEWEDGESVETILSVCKRNVVDLLLIGAVEKENMLKYFMGSVSREISRRAKCSVLMIIEPKLNPIPVQRMVVNGHDHSKTIHSIETAVYLAQKEKLEEIFILDEVDIPAVSMSIADDSTGPEVEQIKESIVTEESTRLSGLLSSIDSKGVRLKTKTFAGRRGFTIGQYAQEMNADLIVVNSPDHHMNIFDRIFTHDLEYMLADLPCNMLIVHSRVF
jgi:nucleotide-binding universal stress UspA family protein